MAQNNSINKYEVEDFLHDHAKGSVFDNLAAQKGAVDVVCVQVFLNLSRA